MKGLFGKVLTNLVLALVWAGGANAGSMLSVAGPQATFGTMSNGHSQIGNTTNPAVIAWDRSRLAQGKAAVGGFHLGGGISYGNVEELFNRVDEVASTLSNSTDNGSGQGGDSSSGVSVDGGIDINNPDLAELTSRLEQHALAVGGLLAIIAVEGYAFADVTLELPFILNADVMGGTLGFELSASGKASAVSFLDPPLLSTASSS